MPAIAIALPTPPSTLTGVPKTAIVTSMITTRRIVLPTACVTGEMFESARNCTSEYAVK